MFILTVGAKYIANLVCVMKAINVGSSTLDVSLMRSRWSNNFIPPLLFTDEHAECA